jgi:hypothetical protein
MRTRKSLFALLMSCWSDLTEIQNVSDAAITKPLISASFSGITVKLSYNSTTKVSGNEVSVSTNDSSTFYVIYTCTRTSATLTKVAYVSTLVFQVAVMC